MLCRGKKWKPQNCNITKEMSFSSVFPWSSSF
jgi:hypothetical protein